MVKSEERLKVLKMVQEGKITVEQATSLLEALEEMPAAAGKTGAAPAIAGAPAPGSGQPARWLRVDAPLPARAVCPLVFEPTEDVKNDLLELDILEGSPMAGRQILELGLPSDVLIMLVNRGGECLVPSGGTTIETGDVVLAFADRDMHPALRALAAASRPS